MEAGMPGLKHMVSSLADVLIFDSCRSRRKQSSSARRRLEQLRTHSATWLCLLIIRRRSWSSN